MKVYLCCLFVMCISINSADGFQNWEIQELYTNVDGSIQYVELYTSFSVQAFINGKSINSSYESGLNNFTFSGNAPFNTINRHLLIATQGFADLDGAPVPDYILADDFLFIPTESGDPNGASVDFLGADMVSYLEIPVDGFNSLHFDIAGNSTESVNTPTNYNGDTFTIIPACLFTALAGDFNNDCMVDILDYELLVDGWLGTYYMDDFGILSNSWLVDCLATPEDPLCLGM